jgi:pyruvate-ferredoxin/flavodoxin oxidoreductase
LAVDSGIWPLYRFDPRKVQEGKPPLTLDSTGGKASVQDYMHNETRFRMVEKLDPQRFKKLSNAAQADMMRRVALYQHMAQLVVPQKNGNGNGKH